MTSINELTSIKQAREQGLEAGRTAKNQKRAYCRYPADSRASSEWMHGFIHACQERGVEPVLADGRNAKNFQNYTENLPL
jgi:hypothetical protein